MNFTKKPVTIQAVQFDGSSSGIGEIQAWMQTGEHKRGEIRTQDCGRVLEIETLEGVMTAQPGDWIIKGVKGEFYPCKPDIFAVTYDEAAPVTAGPHRGVVMVEPRDEAEILRILRAHGATIINRRRNDMLATVELIVDHPCLEPAQLGQPTPSYTVSLENGNTVFRQVAA